MQAKFGPTTILAIFLSGCLAKTTKDSELTTPSDSLDPSLYTIEATMLYDSDVAPNFPLPYSGSWVDGGGTFENSLESGVRFRMALTPSNRNKDQRFTLTYAGNTATSPALNFDDCDFAADSGYDPTDFHKMKVYFAYDSRKNSIIRRGLSSFDADPAAVTCEKVEVKSKTAVVYLSAPADLRIQSQNRLVVPYTLSKDQFGIQSLFRFYPTLTGEEHITVSSKTDSFPYPVSLKYCVDYFAKNKIDVNTLGSEYVDLSLENTLIDHGYSCCSFDGACSPRID